MLPSSSSLPAGAGCCPSIPNGIQKKSPSFLWPTGCSSSLMPLLFSHSLFLQRLPHGLCCIPFRAKSFSLLSCGEALNHSKTLHINDGKEWLFASLATSSHCFPLLDELLGMMGSSLTYNWQKTNMYHNNLLTKIKPSWFRVAEVLTNSSVLGYTYFFCCCLK